MSVIFLWKVVKLKTALSNRTSAASSSSRAASVLSCYLLFGTLLYSTMQTELYGPKLNSINSSNDTTTRVDTKLENATLFANVLFLPLRISFKVLGDKISKYSINVYCLCTSDINTKLIYCGLWILIGVKTFQTTSNLFLVFLSFTLYLTRIQNSWASLIPYPICRGSIAQWSTMWKFQKRHFLHIFVFFHTF